MVKTEILIVGTGIAGLSTALYLATTRPDIRITLLDKGQGTENSTILAQGGLAAVVSKTDSLQMHVKDTLEAGHYMNEPKMVWEIISKAPEIIHDLSNWGVKWDLDDHGNLDLGLEGGHSHPRIVHHQDYSGKAVHRQLHGQLLKYKNVEFLYKITVRDLWLEHGKCIGIVAFKEDESEEWHLPAQHVILATGGIGAIFARTTNPKCSTGDGLAMAIRSGVKTRDLPWIQFHPTALDTMKNEPVFLLTEALRGKGCHIVDQNEYRFLFDSLPNGELSPRDLVCESIWKEIQKKPGAKVFLDCRHLEKNMMGIEFPQVDSICRLYGLDPSKDLLPIAPAAHYHCGGIETNKIGQTSQDGLFAVGEVACTGLHGSNRLASNSLIEAMVIAKNLACHLANSLKREEIDHPKTRKVSNSHPFNSSISLNELRDLFTKYYLKTKPLNNLFSDEISIRKEKLNEAVISGYYSNQTLAERNIIEIYSQLL